MNEGPIPGARLVQDGDDQILLLPEDFGWGIGIELEITKANDEITIRPARSGDAQKLGSKPEL